MILGSGWGGNLVAHDGFVSVRMLLETINFEVGVAEIPHVPRLDEGYLVI